MRAIRKRRILGTATLFTVLTIGPAIFLSANPGQLSGLAGDDDKPLKQRVCEEVGCMGGTLQCMDINAEVEGTFDAKVVKITLKGGATVYCREGRD